MKKYIKGFTLIELLVVIAIIGILASVVLFSLQSARKKGGDSRVISDVQQLRTHAESMFNGTDYGVVLTTNFAIASGNGIVAGTVPSALITDATDNKGFIFAQVSTNKKGYAIYGALPSTNQATYFCIGSDGSTNQSTALTSGSQAIFDAKFAAATKICLP